MDDIDIHQIPSSMAYHPRDNGNTDTNTDTDTDTDMDTRMGTVKQGKEKNTGIIACNSNSLYR